MTHLMIFWYVTVGIVLVTFMVQFFRYLTIHNGRHVHAAHAHHIFSFGRERDMFFVAGDSPDIDDDDAEYDQ